MTDNIEELMTAIQQLESKLDILHHEIDIAVNDMLIRQTAYQVALNEALKITADLNKAFYSSRDGISG